MPALLALLASLLWGTADFLGGSASRRLPLASVVGVSQLVALLGLLPVAVLTGALDEPRSYVLPGVAAGVVGPLALAAFYRALSAGTMGVVAPVAALGVLVPVAAGLAGGESPSGLQLGGITAAVVGVVLASGPELSGGRGGGTPLVLAGLAAVGFGTVFVLLADGAGSGSLGAVVMTLLTMRLVTVLLMSALLLATSRSRGVELGVRRADLPVLLVIGAFDVGANAAFAVASQSDLISITAVLASLYPVVTVLLARRLHGEQLVGVQLPGVVLSLVGVVLLAGG